MICRLTRAATLSTAIRTPTDDGPRDIILLTHPSNAREPAVQFAISDRRSSDRVFALMVDDDGKAELSDWRRSGPICLRSFRVDLPPMPNPSRRRPK